MKIDRCIRCAIADNPDNMLVRYLSVLCRVYVWVSEYKLNRRKRWGFTSQSVSTRNVDNGISSPPLKIAP